MRAKRVYFHYNRANKALTIHFDKKCHLVQDVECNIPTESKWNWKQQPNLVLQGWAKEVIIENNKAIIS